MAFDVAKFLNTEYDTAFETKRTLIPEGEWRGYVKGIDVSAGNKEHTAIMRVTIEFDDQDLKAEESMKGRDVIQMVTTIFIDLDPETGLIKYAGGANWQVGQLRAAVGQNVQGKPWNPGMLEQQGPLGVRVTHREMTKPGPDGKRVGTGDIMDNVSAWLAV